MTTGPSPISVSPPVADSFGNGRTSLAVRLLVSGLVAALIGLAVTGCSGSAPNRTEIVDQIKSELMRRTAGQFLVVTAVDIVAQDALPDGRYAVKATIGVRFTRDIDDFVQYLLSQTPAESGANAAGIRAQLRRKLEKTYGNAKAGATATYTERFFFEKREFGWRLIAPRDEFDFGL